MRVVIQAFPQLEGIVIQAFPQLEGRGFGGKPNCIPVSEGKSSLCQLCHFLLGQTRPEGEPREIHHLMVKSSLRTATSYGHFVRPLRTGRHRKRVNVVSSLSHLLIVECDKVRKESMVRGTGGCIAFSPLCFHGNPG